MFKYYFTITFHLKNIISILTSVLIIKGWF